MLSVGLGFWVADLFLLIYYVRKYMKNGGGRPSIFTLFTIILTLAGVIYSLIRLVYGPSVISFVAMSGISTAMAIFLFVIIAVKLSKRGEH